MPQVAVTAVAVLCVKGKVDAVLAAVLDLVFPGLHGPQVCHTPWSDDLDIRSQRFDGKLKADLVIALTCCAVADCDSSLFPCDLNETLCDGRAGHSCTDQVFVLIYCVSLHAGNDVIVAEIIHDIFYI